MAKRNGPANIKRYSLEFKLKAVQPAAWGADQGRGGIASSEAALSP
jgi:hypothetical protein